MNAVKIIGWFLLLGGLVAGCADKDGSREDRAMDRYIDRLLGEMTVEEKIGQLNLTGIEGSVRTGPAIRTGTGEKIVRGEVGGLLNVMSSEKILELQRIAVNESRMGIPLLFGMDVIHGYNTVFPIPLGLSATWNRSSIETAARISAVEASAQGVCWTYSPMVDISYDARWGRVAEGAAPVRGGGGAVDGTNAAGVGGEHGPRQGTALHAHHRQHRENHRQGTPPIAGQIVYGRYLSHLHLPHLRFTHHYTLPTGEWQRAFFTNSPALAILEKSKNHRF